MKPAPEADLYSTVADRATAFIHANADRRITVSDIADAIHVSDRTLVRAFHRHLRTTPAAYLKTARLAGARHDLQAASAGATTVTTVATRWGFHDLGRFAATYRAAYGEEPRVTLAHRQAAPEGGGRGPLGVRRRPRVGGR